MKWMSCRAPMVLVAVWSLGVASPAWAQAATTDETPRDEVASARPAEPTPSERAAADRFAGYDFGRVVETLQRSVEPLRTELDGSIGRFLDAVDEAEHLLGEDKPRQAASLTVEAIDDVLQHRRKVLDAMWEGQEQLQGQVAQVRHRLATALDAAEQGGDQSLDPRMERILDRLAQQVASTEDPLRKRWLTAHYRSVRSQARIRQMARQLSPDQRRLWSQVLQVLERSSVAHQQLLVGSELLFAQFEVTSANLREYLALLDTVDGASRLLGVIEGGDEAQAGLTRFTRDMEKLQERLATFNSSVESALKSSMFELEAKVESVHDAPVPLNQPIELDEELSSRIRRLEREAGADEGAR